VAGPGRDRAKRCRPPACGASHGSIPRSEATTSSQAPPPRDGRRAATDSPRRRRVVQPGHRRRRGIALGQAGIVLRRPPDLPRRRPGRPSAAGEEPVGPPKPKPGIVRRWEGREARPDG
jgi:hypothetical protein